MSKNEERHRGKQKTQERKERGREEMDRELTKQNRKKQREKERGTQETHWAGKKREKRRSTDIPGDKVPKLYTKFDGDSSSEIWGKNNRQILRLVLF